MNIINVSVRELKINAANALIDKKNKDICSILDKYFGALPDFPDVAKKRTFRKRSDS